MIAELLIALQLLRGTQAVSVSPTTPPPQTMVTSVLGPTNDQQYQDAILRQSQFTQPKVTTPKSVKDVTTGVVVPVRTPTDTPQQIRDRLRYGSGL